MLIKLDWIELNWIELTKLNKMVTGNSMECRKVLTPDMTQIQLKHDFIHQILFNWQRLYIWLEKVLRCVQSTKLTETAPVDESSCIKNLQMTHRSNLLILQIVCHRNHTWNPATHTRHLCANTSIKCLSCTIWRDRQPVIWYVSVHTAGVRHKYGCESWKFKGCKSLVTECCSNWHK